MGQNGFLSQPRGEADFPIPGDLPRLREIWLRSFGASVPYANLFFEHRFSPKETLVWRRDGEVQAMLFWLPATLFAQDQQGPVAYVYGVATHPNARGQGISSQLQEALKEELVGRGYWASLLVPATPSLFSFYERQGYQGGFLQRTACFSASEMEEELTVHPLSPQELFTLRESFFHRQEPYIQWDIPALAYQIREVQLLKGSVCKLQGTHQTGYAVLYVEKDRLTIRELGAQGSFARDCLNALCHHFGRPSAQVRLRTVGDFPFETSLSPFTMVQAFREPIPPLQDGYFSLALD